MVDAVNDALFPKIPLQFYPARMLTPDSTASVLGELVRYLAEDIDPILRYDTILAHFLDMYDLNEETIAPVLSDMIAALARGGVLKLDILKGAQRPNLPHDMNIVLCDDLIRIVHGDDMIERIAAE